MYYNDTMGVFTLVMDTFGHLLEAFDHLLSFFLSFFPSFLLFNCLNLIRYKMNMKKRFLMATDEKNGVEWGESEETG